LVPQWTALADAIAGERIRDKNEIACLIVCNSHKLNENTLGRVT
jgi:hypothetical protein